MRPYQDDDDYWRIRAFLRRVFLLNDRRELSWQAYRFDYWRWHGILNMGHGSLEEDVLIWETPDGRIAAVLNPEGPGNAVLQVHPDFGTLELTQEMVAVAEQRLGLPGRKLTIWANEHDSLRQEILSGRGYTKGPEPEHQRRRPISVPIPDTPVPDGYTVRPLGDVDEHPGRSWMSWRAFHPDEPDDRYEGCEWYRNIQRAPLYRRDLDIVAVAPTGEFAAFCTVWFDDVTRTGAFEPVGTAPEHQRLGLGKAVMFEGLRRLALIGATLAYVGGYTPAANALYASAGFTDYDLCEPWSRDF